MTSDHRVAGSSPAGCKSSLTKDLQTILASKIQRSFDRYWLNSALILQRWCFASFESRADPQLPTAPGSMKTATKFQPIPDRVLYTLRFVQAGFDCHIVPYKCCIRFGLLWLAQNRDRRHERRNRGDSSWPNDASLRAQVSIGVIVAAVIVDCYRARRPSHDSLSVALNVSANSKNLLLLRTRTYKILSRS
jgi:hypothetical protein